MSSDIQSVREKNQQHVFPEVSDQRGVCGGLFASGGPAVESLQVLAESSETQRRL